MIHSSVLEQNSVYAALGNDLSEHPELIAPLLPLEDGLRRHWPALAPAGQDPSLHLTRTLEDATEKDTGLTTEAGKRVREKNWLGEIVREIKTSIKKL